MVSILIFFSPRLVFAIKLNNPDCLTIYTLLEVEDLDSCFPEPTSGKVKRKKTRSGFELVEPRLFPKKITVRSRTSLSYPNTLILHHCTQFTSL